MVRSMRVWLLVLVCIALVSSVVALFFGLAAFSGRGSPRHKKYVEMQLGGLNEPFLLSEGEYQRTLTLAEAGNGKAAFKLYWYYEGGVGDSNSAIYWLEK